MSIWGFLWKYLHYRFRWFWKSIYTKNSPSLQLQSELVSEEFFQYYFNKIAWRNACFAFFPNPRNHKLQKSMIIHVINSRKIFLRIQKFPISAFTCGFNSGGINKILYHSIKAPLPYNYAGWFKKIMIKEKSKSTSMCQPNEEKSHIYIKLVGIDHLNLKYSHWR